MAESGCVRTSTALWAVGLLLAIAGDARAQAIESTSVAASARVSSSAALEVPLAVPIRGASGWATRGGGTRLWPLSASGRVSLVDLEARILIGAGLQPTEQFANTTVLLVHDTSGAVRETRELTADGGVVRGYGAIATDGGAIAYGQAGAGSVHGAVVRLGPDGQVRWSVLAPHRPAESCRPRERVCTWSEFHHAIEVGGSVYASLNFHRGSVTFANGTRLRGDRGTFNRAIVRIDARTGVVSQVMPLRGTEYELLASGGRLSALQTTRDGSRLRQEIVRFDPTLRRLSSSRVQTPHSFSSVFALGDGVATVARRDTNEWALTVIDGAGRTTWEHAFDSASVFETSGDLLFVATPLVSSTDQHPLESAPRDGIARGVQVVAYDAAGRAQWSASTSHSFVRRSLGLSVSGPRSVRLTGVRLGGALAPGAAATLVALPLTPANAAALPGALRTSLRTPRSSPSTTRTTASASPSRSCPSEVDSRPQTRMRLVASRLSDRHIESKRR